MKPKYEVNAETVLMPNQFNPEPAAEGMPGEISPEAEGLGGQPEVLGPNGATETKGSTGRSRRVALSKREMMEELSRQRFPWEE